MPQTETRLSHLLGRRAVPAVAVLVVLSFALMAGLLVKIARNQDAHAAAQAVQFVEAIVERRRESIGRDVKDYAAWGEAYQHLHLRTDIDWAFNQQNLGPTLFNDLSYDDVLVVGPAGTITYAVVGGQLVTVPPARLLGAGLDALIAAARAAAPNESKPAVGFLSDGGEPLLAAATAITTGGDPTIVPTPGPSSIMVFADALTPDRLDEIGRKGFVQGLRTARDESDRTAEPFLMLKAADGGAGIPLRWDPERPGAVLLGRILPWLVLAGLAFVLLSVLILRRATRAAELIESNTQELTEAHRQAEHSALHDGVTELPNRLMLHRYLEDRYGPDGWRGSVALIYIDLDRFKPINDAFGHVVGDAVLKQTAARLRTVSRPGDIVARVGGDEFVLAFTEPGSADEISRVCTRLIAAVSLPIVVEGAPVQVGLSIGVALAPADGHSPEQIVRHADIAMYQAKTEGGNRFQFFSGEMNERIAVRIALERDLRRAVEADEFVLHFQPRYDTASMRLLGVEALLRWAHPLRGLLSPAAFIGLAEETGLIVTVGAWVLRRACAAIAPYPDIMVSVNVSPAQFRDPAIIEHVADALRDSGLPGERLELELTETMLLEDVDKACDVMLRLKTLGVRLAMDDFGTGYSSLGYLRRFPFDRLKIDQQFVADLHPAGDSRAIVQAILGLGRALKLSVTAEGVETPEQLLLLRADRCDEVQGYHLSRPLSEDRLAEMLHRPGNVALASAG